MLIRGRLRVFRDIAAEQVHAFDPAGLDPQEGREAIEVGADLILLDNMTPEMVREAREIAGPEVQLEVSGGVSIDTVGDYASAGATFISVGAITHSAPAVDIGLDLD